MRLWFVLFSCALSFHAQAQDAKAAKDAVRVQIVSSTPAPPQTLATTALVDGDKCPADMDDASLRDLVRSEAARQGVEEKLALAILNQESRDGADLNSRKGARGPMQLMPETAATYGVKDICNPVENVWGGIAFLKDLTAQFQGNMMLVAAAYDAGIERVFQSGGVPAISETVRYVASVTNKYYGLDELSARRSKRAGKKGPPSAPGSIDSDSAPAAKRDSQKQEWIGGSVLYVTNDDNGDKQ